MNITLKLGLALISLLALSACNSIGLACKAPAAPPPSESASLALSEQVLEPLPSFQRRVYLSRIVDVRGLQPIDPALSGAIRPKGDVSRALRNSLKESLESNGVKFGFVGMPILQGRLLDWHAVTDTEMFQDSVSAKAVIELSLFLPDNRRAYRAIYTGEATRSNTLFTNPRVKSALEVALLEAIDEAASDPKLLERIERARI